MHRPDKRFVPDFIESSLGTYLENRGSFLYSSHRTISPGKIYLLGLNPGGCGGPSLKDNLAVLLTNEENSYLDHAWENNSGSYAVGEAPLQKRVTWLLSNLGANPREVLSTNLIFKQSRDMSGISKEDADICWPIHELLLQIVQPRLILSHGNAGLSPYQYMHSRYGGNQQYTRSGHGSWSLKGFKVEMQWGEVFVAGLPHLSRYCPIGKQQVIDWLRCAGKIDCA